MTSCISRVCTRKYRMDKHPRRLHRPSCADKTAHQDNRYIFGVVFSSSALILVPGICFGHQIIARALGGECVPNDGRWELGPTPLQLTHLGKRIFGSDELVSLSHTIFFITLRNAFRSFRSLSSFFLYLGPICHHSAVIPRPWILV
jgi:hypothetical protein